jgi:hypothetical protein
MPLDYAEVCVCVGGGAGNVHHQLFLLYRVFQRDTKSVGFLRVVLYQPEQVIKGKVLQNADLASTGFLDPVMVRNAFVLE